MLFVVMALVTPFAPFTLGMRGFALTCMTFNKWVFDSLDILNDFTRQVVVSRREAGVRKWTNLLREDLGARPCAWLRPDFVPPSPFHEVKDPLTEASRILVEPHLTDAGFCEAWMPFFCRSGHPVITFDQFFGLPWPSFASGVSVGSSLDHGAASAGGCWG